MTSRENTVNSHQRAYSFPPMVGSGCAVPYDCKKAIFIILLFFIIIYFFICRFSRMRRRSRRAEKLQQRSGTLISKFVSRL